MTSHIVSLTPQMLHYTDRLYEDGKVHWLPYVMFFQPANHESPIANTDRLGFRIARNDHGQASVGGRLPAGPVNVIAGGSTAFGVGATADAATVPSRLWSTYAPEYAWLNFGGRGHNSAQELINFTLHQHLLPEVRNIVLFSGLNTLSLARLPERLRGEHGAFYNCNEFIEIMYELHRPPRVWGLSQLLSRDRTGPSARYKPPPTPPAAEQVGIAVDLTLRHLAGWRRLADSLGATLSFALQPLATWVRDRPAPPEQLLFDELDGLFRFSDLYGDIIPAQVGHDYAVALRAGCEGMGVRFIELGPLLADAVAPDDWIFVDRAHLTDQGYDVVAALLAHHLDLH